MKQEQKKLVYIAIALFVIVLVGNSLYPLIGISVSKLYIDLQGYEDPASHEWRGSFWSVVMVTDWTDQIAGFHLAANTGDPSETYAESLEGSVKAQSYTIGDKQLVPTADVMVHITPRQPYYERPLEIQQGNYVKGAWGRQDGSGGWTKTSDHADAVAFVHYSFGAGSWTLHTPFKVDVYKEGVLLATQEIDTVGATGIYRIPASGEEFINIIDLGKLSTGYGEPQWDDILYFSENYIFVRSPTADILLKYDSGQIPVGVYGSSILGVVDADCFSTYWYGYHRYFSDSSAAPVGTSANSVAQLYAGYYLENGIAKPRAPDVFSNVIPYLQNRGIQKVSMPTGFDHLTKTADNNLRVYMKYGAYSSLITIKISTELADTIVWQPQVANFEITSFPDFGDITDTRTASITIKCLEGTGSATITLTKDPTDTPASFTPTLGTQTLTTGQSQTLNFDILNLGTSTTKTFTINAQVKNSLGSVTDTASASGRLLQKTGATTILHVITQFEGKPISDLPVMIEYSGTSQTKTTGLDGLGTATFNLGTSADISVKATFAGNAVYQPASKTTTVSGGSEKTLTLALTKHDITPPPYDWTTILLLLAVGVALILLGMYYFRGKKRPRRSRRKNK